MGCQAATRGTSGTTDSWRADVWSSADLGATWTGAYAGVATRLVGKDTTDEAHHFVGILADGTWLLGRRVYSMRICGVLWAV